MIKLQFYIPLSVTLMNFRKSDSNNFYFFILQDLEELDPDFIMAKQVEQLEKEKKELQERLKNQEKKVNWWVQKKYLVPLHEWGFNSHFLCHRLTTLREQNALKRSLSSRRPMRSSASKTWSCGNCKRKRGYVESIIKTCLLKLLLLKCNISFFQVLQKTIPFCATVTTRWTRRCKVILRFCMLG